METGARKQPLYDQLVGVLKDKIETELVPNDMLPSERELTERFGISRTTVRLALRELEEMGYVYRRHGKGTFVAERTANATNLSQGYSFTEQMRAAGRRPESVILLFREIQAPKNIAQHLGLALGEHVWELHRLRKADGLPMMVERSYLPKNRFMTLDEEQLAAKPMYDVFEFDYGVFMRVAEEEFMASVARPEDAALLGIEAGAPVLAMQRTTIDTTNQPVEFTLSVARADQFKYKITHFR